MDSWCLEILGSGRVCVGGGGGGGGGVGIKGQKRNLLWLFRKQACTNNSKQRFLYCACAKLQHHCIVQTRKHVMFYS